MIARAASSSPLGGHQPVPGFNGHGRGNPVEPGNPPDDPALGIDRAGGHVSHAQPVKKPGQVAGQEVDLAIQGATSAHRRMMHDIDENAAIERIRQQRHRHSAQEAGAQNHRREAASQGYGAGGDNRLAAIRLERPGLACRVPQTTDQRFRAGARNAGRRAEPAFPDGAPGPPACLTRRPRPRAGPWPCVPS